MKAAMNEATERLIQRFLDAELTRAERRQLLEMLAEYPELRERLVIDETMLDMAAGLPRATPGADFVARTVARLPVQDPVEGALREPLRFALPAAAAAVVLLAVGFVAGRAMAPAPSRQAVHTAAPESAVLVQMMLVQPDAHSVVVVGDFNGWDPMRSPLQKRDNGVWATSLTLTPGRYNYMFLIDGTKWVADPLAGETSADGFGAKNSVLDVEV